MGKAGNRGLSWPLRLHPGMSLRQGCVHGDGSAAVPPARQEPVLPVFTPARSPPLPCQGSPGTSLGLAGSLLGSWHSCERCVPRETF